MAAAVVVAVVGKPAPELAAAIAHNERRAGRYWNLEVRQYPGTKVHRGQPANAARDDWNRILLAVAPRANLWVCDERGRSLTSPAFAQAVRDRRDAGEDMVLVVGGAQGLPDEARERADVVLALAPWTLSHDLARLVLAEQLYRAGTIVRGEPYHK